MTTLQELMRRYKAGDESAQQELLEQMETQLRGLVRLLMGKQIRTERESIDVCQSLMLAFHMRAAEGKLEIDSEEALRAYLRGMIRNKMANLSDRIKTAKRGGGAQPVSLERARPGDDEEMPALQVPAHDPSASMVARTAELRRQLEAVLSPDELAILEGRLAGRTNQEIADETGKTADAVRMTWNRAREKLVSRGLIPDRP